MGEILETESRHLTDQLYLGGGVRIDPQRRQLRLPRGDEHGPPTIQDHGDGRSGHRLYQPHRQLLHPVDAGVA